MKLIVYIYNMKLQYLYDIFNNKYIGLDIKLNATDINGLSLNNLLNIASNKIINFNNCNDKLLIRNNNKYHITIFNVAEYNKNKKIDKFIGLTINNIEFLGIGSINKKDKETYFIVVKINILQSLRKTLNLKSKDLHITIGFTDKDLFNKSKNICNIYSIN